MSDDQITKALNDGNFCAVYDDLIEGNVDYMFEILDGAAKEIAKEFGIKKQRDIDEINGNLDIDWNLDQLIRQTHCHLAMVLNLEYYPYDGISYGNVYFKKTLKKFGVNPASLRYGYKGMPNKPRVPCVDVDGFIDCLVNTGYPSVYVVMMDSSTLKYLVEHSAEILKDGITIKAGANIITQDYMNGASGVPFKTTADIHFKASEIYDIRNDDAYMCGVQRTCGFINSEWNGKITEE